MVEAPYAGQGDDPRRGGGPGLDRTTITWVAEAGVAR
jgi:hypothetical protein